MKKTKKLIAMLLTLMMLLSILPVAAFAETKETFVSPVTGSVNPSSSVELMVGDTLAMKVYSSDPFASGTFSVVVTGDKDALEGCPDNVSKSNDTLCNISAVKAGTVTITIGNAVLSVTVKGAEPAGDSINYIDADGKEAPATATKLTKDSTSWSGWVYVTGDVTISQNVTLSDNVNLILEDNASLEITKGITGSGKTLTVYAQSGGSGKLSVTGEDKTNAAGGNGITANIMVCGGIVDITGGTGGIYDGIENGQIGGNGISGSLMVYGGKVTVTGGTGGNGKNSTKSAGSGGNGITKGSVIVSGGEVEVKGGITGSGKPGTGSGGIGISLSSGYEVTVSGSATLTVIGTNGQYGGYGIVASSSDVTIRGGVLNVTGGNSVSSNGFFGILGNLVVQGGSATIKGGNGGVGYTGARAVSKETQVAEGLIVSKTEPDGTTGGTLIISSEPPHTHTVGTKNEAVAPTCTADGTIEWYSCTDETCEAYLDAEGNELESIVDPAAHTYGDPVAVWTGDSCTATCTCTVCAEGTDGHSISEAKKGTFVQDTAATCIEAAKGHYEVTFDDTQFGTAQTDANTASNGEPIEHSYTGEYVQNEEHTKHAQLCVNGCGQPGEFTDCTGGKATCQAKAVCETCLKEYGELAGHSFTNYVYNNDASCTKAGTKTAKCDNCEATDTVDDLEHPQLDHSYTGEVKDNGNGTHSFLCVNGCNEYGGTVECVDETGKDHKCDVCGKVLSEHQFGGWTTGETRRYRECSVCGFTESESLEPDTKVDVSFDPAAFSAESAAAVTIKVEEMSADKTEVIAIQNEVIAAAENKEAVVFDVTALVNAEAVHQLAEGYKVLVRIAIPEGYSNVEVYYIDGKGNTEKLESWIEGDYVCFYTDHFSAYAVVGDVEPECGIVSYLKKIDFLHFGDWLARFHEFMRTLDFLSVFRKISGFVCYIFEGAKIIFVC